MIKKVVAYTDFNGVEKTKELYFHISKADILRAPDDVYDEIIELGKEITERAQVIQKLDVAPNDDDPFDRVNLMLADAARMIARLLDRLVDLSYGERSEDGSKFIKNKEVVEDFKSSEAYSAFLEHMITHQEEMLELINSLLKKN